MPGEGVEVAIQLLHVHAQVRHRLGAVEQHGDAPGVGQVDDRLDRVDRAQRVGDVGQRDELRPRRQQALELVQEQFAGSLIGTTRSRAPFSSQSICQGTMLEWCSIQVMRTSSPAWSRCPAEALGDEVDRLGGAAGEDDLARLGALRKLLHLDPGRLVSLAWPARSAGARRDGRWRCRARSSASRASRTARGFCVVAALSR